MTSTIMLLPERREVRVRVPGTSANLGPGFDCMGLAVDVWNDLSVEHSDTFCLEIEGEGAAELPRDESNLVVTGIKLAFRAAGKPVPPLKYRCNNNIPFARGLGSSSAAVVSGLIAGLVLTGCELPVMGDETLFNLACEIEGHPDNVAPAIYGGLQIGVKIKSKPDTTTNSETIPTQTPGSSSQSHYRWYSSRVSIPSGLQCVFFLPDHTLETSTSRDILPRSVQYGDAIFNASRCALFVNALTTGNFCELKLAMQDRLHQPHRNQLNPHLMPIIEAAESAGAHGACLSGAGPAVFAITSGAKGDIYSQLRGERSERNVAESMLQAAESLGVKGRVLITQPTEKGAHVVLANPPFSGKYTLHFTHSTGTHPI